jgi:hypothetical protein
LKVGFTSIDPIGRITTYIPITSSTLPVGPLVVPLLTDDAQLLLSVARPMTPGYWLSATDNDSYMLNGPTPHASCGACGLPLDRDWIDPYFQFTRRDLDASYTYDGYLIGSEKFRAATSGRGARFISLPSTPGFYSVRIDAAVRFDAVRRRTKFEDFCPECQRYRTVVGALPVFLLPGEAIPPDQLVRTDLEFGSGNEQRPIVLVGSDLAKELIAASLAGIALKRIAQ